MGEKIDSLKEHWKFNSVIASIAVFVTDGIYMVAYFLIQTFFIMNGYNWDFIELNMEKVKITLFFLTPFVFVQVFVLSWLGKFAERFEREDPKEQEQKENVIDWDSI